METIKNPFKFLWNLAITFAVWAFMAVCYEAGWIYWQEFTFVHTFIAPAMYLVALAPLSVKRVVRSEYLLPYMAVWEGVMIPTVYLVMRWITGFGHHCDRASLISGVLGFLGLLAYWAIATFVRRVRRKLDRSIQAAIV